MKLPSPTPPASSRQFNWPVWIPTLSVILCSVAIRGFDLDRKISAFNYDPILNKWPFERADPWLSFYRYGIYPPLALGILGAVVFVFAGTIWPRLEPQQRSKLRRGGLFLALMLAIGPGLLVNGGLKSFCGRPRPLQCTDFGGELPFRQVGEFTTQNFPNSSFPSGHASIAFFMMGPAFLAGAHQTRRRLYWLLGGSGYGLAMGCTRVLQGGHFVSDVLWAGLIVYLVGVGLSRILIRTDQADLPATANQERPLNQKLAA